MSDRLELNQQPPTPKADALPICAAIRNKKKYYILIVKSILLYLIFLFNTQFKVHYNIYIYKSLYLKLNIY